MIEIKEINANNTFVMLAANHKINDLHCDALKKEIKKVLERVEKRFIFDMTGIVNINGKGIENLSAMRDITQKKGICFTIYGIEPQVVEKLEVLRLRENFELYGEQYIGEFIPIL
jgi:anti-anti-sigma regulatory factor